MPSQTRSPSKSLGRRVLGTQSLSRNFDQSRADRGGVAGTAELPLTGAADAGVGQRRGGECLRRGARAHASGHVLKCRGRSPPMIPVSRPSFAHKRVRARALGARDSAASIDATLCSQDSKSVSAATSGLQPGIVPRSVSTLVHLSH